MPEAIRSQYELSSSTLASWVEEQGADEWWTVDGDPILTSKLFFPCPGDELAMELRQINRPMLLLTSPRQPIAAGTAIGPQDVDKFVQRLREDLLSHDDPPVWAKNRFLNLVWKDWDDSPAGWLLVEDLETTENSRADAASSGEAS